jgi:hypothetical protein
VHTRLLLLLSLLALPLSLWGQSTGKITGTVIDEQKQPVVGANVMVEGTTLGAATDPDGKYIILNIPPGTYTVRASAVGSAPQRTSSVRVAQGLTTHVDIVLRSSAVQMGEVVVEHKAPPVVKDLTSKMQGFGTDDLQKLPVQTSLQSILTRQAGITANIMTTPVSSQPVFGQFATIPNDGLHFRGGRTNETLYLFDGITVNDGLWGGFDLDAVGQYTLSSLRTLTGTFGPQYGEAMSGVVEMQTPDNPQSSYALKALTYTDRLGGWANGDHSVDYEVQASGPVPGVSSLTFFGSARRYTTDGNLFGYITPNYIDSEGRDKTGPAVQVPMAFRDNEMAFGKLLWQPIEQMKVRAGLLATRTVRGAYHHYFKYNPDGTPHVHLGDLLGYLKVTHLLGQSTFYDLSVSHYRRTFTSHVFDTPAAYAIRPETGSAEFSTSGEDFVRFNSDFRRLELSAAITSQVTREHLLSAGIVLDRMETSLQRVNPNGNELTWTTIEDYDVRPLKTGAYVNDKMEFDDMGLVVNLGVRYDRINPKRTFVVDITSPEGRIGRVPSRHYWSPRLGISYPISDVAAFRFGYGHYYQYPDFFKAFQGMNQQYALYPAPNVRSVSGAVATGDIEEEKTVNYEFGVQFQLGGLGSADVTGFYRKVSNLIGIVVVNGYLTEGSIVKEQRFPVFDNVSAATVKGIEVSLSRRFADNFSGFFNYTYSEALTSSSFLFSLPREGQQEFPADWDQTHVASFGLSFEFPSQWGFSLLGSVSSGFPYTYTQFQPNAERAPWMSSLDAMVFKEFTVAGVTARVFFQAVNLLNRRNIWWVYPDSGQPGVDANPSTSDDYTNDPSMWGPGRRFQTGVSISL